ncbi:hypothetical protein AB2B38_004025 [Balneola sp. MJW-20]|uniref:hypothetical protein n=1 Tax=Gracilimonas aurantiaca TaxID=3234185 RepID=UPI003467E81E
MGINAQSLTIQTQSGSGNNTPAIFTLNGTDIELGRGTLSINTVNYSADSRAVDVNGMAVILNDQGISRIGQNGAVLYKADYQAPGEEDPSLKVYAVYNGGFVLRENIANFLLYDSFGDLKHSISNSTQSQGGESISELAADPYFKTIALYNPEYRLNGKSGSRVSVIDGSRSREVFNIDDRVINTVTVSSDGQFIAVGSSASGSDDQVDVVDRYGNLINQFEFDQDVAGFSFSRGNDYLTVYSTGRVVVYETISGERIGSTSLRTPVRAASYFPQDNSIVLITATGQGTILSDIEVRVIDLQQRAIASEEFSQTLGTAVEIPVTIRRTARRAYTIEGLSKGLNIRASF